MYVSTLLEILLHYIMHPSGVEHARFQPFLRFYTPLATEDSAEEGTVSTLLEILHNNANCVRRHALVCIVSTLLEILLVVTLNMPQRGQETVSTLLEILQDARKDADAVAGFYGCFNPS